MIRLSKFSASLYRYRKSNYLSVRCYTKLPETPFDVTVKAKNDPGCDELNSFYTDLFTPKENNSFPPTETVDSTVDEINEINREFDELCNPVNSILSGNELISKIQGTDRLVLCSLSNDPYYNLALEDYVFQNTPVTKNEFISERLIFYINDKCAVIGKNQTVWKELYLQALEKEGYQYLRRFSGGGTVVHDLGNVNFSFLTSRNQFNRLTFNKKIVDWLSSKYPQIEMSLNERGDLTHNGLKVSGSAYKIARGKAYHHGTMLLDSQIGQFKKFLKPKSTPGIAWKCNSVDSVRSSVTNLPLLTPKLFIDALTTGFKNSFHVKDENVLYCHDNITVNKDIHSTMSKLKSEKWKYMTGPTFEVALTEEGATFKVEKGIVVNSSMPEIIGVSFREFLENSHEYFTPQTLNLIK